MKGIIIAVIAVLFLAACGLGFFFMRTSGNLAELKLDLAAVQSNLTLTQGQLATTETNLTTTQNELDNTSNTLASAQEELKNTSNNLVMTRNNLNSARDDLTSAQALLAKAQTDLASAQNDLSARTKQLSDIQKVYPLKHFASAEELNAWLATQPVTSFTFPNTIALQEAAAKDGWLISSQISYIGNQMVASNTAALNNGDFYIFFCDDHAAILEGNINSPASFY
jgi:hypothetical protein